MIVTARDLSDRLLFPAATAVDLSGVIPPSHFDALAAAGLYGVDDARGPIVETLARGCLATAFVWLQHHALVRTGWRSADVRAGRIRGGIARAGARPGGVTAKDVDGGVMLNGVCPWVSGWGYVQVLQVGALDDEQNVRFFIVDAGESSTLRFAKADLVALDATNTGTLTFTEHFVPADRFTHAIPYAQWSASEAPGSPANGYLALGVAARCTELLQGTPQGVHLESDLERVRGALDAADAATTPQARAEASELAVRAATVLTVVTGSRSILTESHAQRLMREATVLLVFGTRPAIRDELLIRIS